MGNGTLGDGYVEKDGMDRSDVFPDDVGLPTFAFISDGNTFQGHAAVEDLYDDFRRGMGRLDWGDCERILRALKPDSPTRTALGKLSANSQEAETARTFVKRGVEHLMQKIEMGIENELAED